MLGLVTSLKMMLVVGVLVLQIVLPNSYSTIPSTLVVKGQFCSANASCHELGFWELILLFLAFVNLRVSFLLPGTLVSAIEVVPICFRQHFVSEADSHMFSLPGRYIAVDVEVHDVVQVPDPCVRPVMSKLRFPVGLIILLFVPD